MALIECGSDEPCQLISQITPPRLRHGSKRFPSPMKEVQNESGLLPWQRNTRQRTPEKGEVSIPKATATRKPQAPEWWQQREATCYDFTLPDGPLLTQGSPQLLIICITPDHSFKGK